MHRSCLGAIVIDCRSDDLGAATAFWAGALGAEAEPAEPHYATLTPQGGITLGVQRVEHESRVHLDIESDDIEAEVARLEGLGARRIAAIRTWVVMEAPTGQRFCVIRAQSPGFAARARAWEA